MVELTTGHVFSADGCVEESVSCFFQLFLVIRAIGIDSLAIGYHSPSKFFERLRQLTMLDGGSGNVA